jgi:MerR family transcriptional regulator, light-induced transcriptional regulator
MSYRIKTIEQMTGLSRNTITAWERRYDLLDPQKDASGYRAYLDADVEVLLRVRRLLDQGFQIGEVVAKIRAERASGVQPRLPVDGIPEMRSALFETLLAFDRVAAEEVVHRMLELSFRRRLDEVYVPLLREVGDAWAEGRCTVAQEHFATAFVREQMISMLKSLEVGPRDGPLTVCAGFPNDHHELGLMTVAIHLALRGHRVVYLGANLPLDELAAVLIHRNANLVCVSAIAQVDPELVLEGARTLREKAPANTLIAFGGPAAEPLAGHSSQTLLFCGRFDSLIEHLDRRRAEGLPLVG